jgi:DNA invertase Pin-like site-specific DNA recombinase
MNIIGYIRVSTDEQAERGFSLSHQEESIKNYCQNKGHKLISIYREDFSAFRTFEERPEWQKITKYINENKNEVNGILCLRWDRFARNLLEALLTIVKFRKKGVQIVSRENPLDLTNPENQLLLSIYLSQAEIESHKNSRRTKEATRRGKIEGCWMGKAPFGYENSRSGNNRSTLKINEKNAAIVVEIFELMQKGIYTSEQLRKKYSTKGLKLSKQGFLNLLRNIVYTGKIFVSKSANEPGLIVEGLHEGIILPETFQKVQDILLGKKPKMKFHLEKSNLYPLKSFIKCKVHDRKLTAAGNRSRNGSIHHYYHCTVPKCPERYRVEVMEGKIVKILDSLKVPEEIVNLYKLILKDVFNQKTKISRNNIESIEKQIRELKMRKESLEDDFISKRMEYQIFEGLCIRIDEKIINATRELEEMKEGKIPIIKMINEGINILPNISSYYIKANGNVKQQILGSMFSEELLFEKGKIRTIPWREVISNLFLSMRDLEMNKMKKVGNFSNQSSCAPPVGLEPTTL